MNVPHGMDRSCSRQPIVLQLTKGMDADHDGELETFCAQNCEAAFS